MSNIEIETRQSALSRIISAVSSKSAKAVAYTATILGIAALYPGLQLPPELLLFAEGLGINLLSNLIDRVANDNKVTDGEIVKEVERIIEKSLADNLLTKDEFYHAFSLLRKGQKSIATQTKNITQILEQMEKNRENARQISKSNIESEIINYSALLRDKTEGFVGRKFIFDSIKEFINENSSGYFVIQGEPGIGKTAIAAELVKNHAYFHHFLLGTQGIVGCEQFVRNITAQIASKYDLGELFVPKTPIENGKPLMNLLERVSDVRNHDNVVIVLDGLDEAEFLLSRSSNIFYLPATLPTHIYFVLTYRPKNNELIPLYTTSPYKTIYIEADSQNNLLDIEAYLGDYFKKSKIRQVLKEEGVGEKEFVDLMIHLSEGNFMYLHYVLPEIERGDYSKLSIGVLPKGLLGYYDYHWQKMRNEDDKTWVLYQEPIILYLAVAKEPLSISMLSKLTGIPEYQIRTNIKNWSEFLIQDQINGKTTHRIYHNSFKEYLKRKSEIGEIDLIQVETKVAEVLRAEWQNIKNRYQNKGQ